MPPPLGPSEPVLGRGFPAATCGMRAAVVALRQGQTAQVNGVAILTPIASRYCPDRPQKPTIWVPGGAL